MTAWIARLRAGPESFVRSLDLGRQARFLVGMADEQRRTGPGVAAPREGVMLLHGLGRTRLGMQLLARRLDLAGFETVCVGYGSRRLSLAEATEAVAGEVARLARRWDVVHLVGHSLGGVLSAAVATGRPDLPVGRVVMIGAPMRGSELAAWCLRFGLLRAAFGPVLADLAFDHGPVQASDRIGAIAGTAGSELLGREVGLLGTHDGKVTRRSAWAGAGHRAAVPVGHALLPFSQRVAELTARFLRDGRFPAEAES
jgi:pimeloyl-ACP methyl ester carboxylesterase